MNQDGDYQLVQNAWLVIATANPHAPRDCSPGAAWLTLLAWGDASICAWPPLASLCLPLHGRTLPGAKGTVRGLVYTGLYEFSHAVWGRQVPRGKPNCVVLRDADQGLSAELLGGN